MEALNRVRSLRESSFDCNSLYVWYTRILDEFKVDYSGKRLMV
jgi:hypothetical protein